MTKQIPEQFLDLFKKKAFAQLATLMPDGSPQVTPVWVDYDGRYLIVNSARGRQKDRNIARDQRVALAISDPDNPYRVLKVRGRVVEITEEGAREGIDRLSIKYTGEKYKHLQPGEVRVIYRIEPLFIS